MNSGVVRKEIRFYGRVQGVGFRYYAVYEARNLGLSGWVENLDDGTVLMEVQGREEQIDALIQYLEHRDWIWIEKMRTRDLPVEEDESDFVEKGW